MITWVQTEAHPGILFAPGSGSIFSMVAWISFKPRPCSFKIPSRQFISLS